ncbi:terminal beta-(1-_2)-arabinofuranosyltransferase [Mycobacterium heckeshornense]|uniref:Membrane protein n=1 Tax=Mycobacterium heckeshornense TaxID=110505 RepID=A0A2I3EQQ7_9MYCO|nr:membrane protein [Mycobacterium heckeshornense]BCO33758.1 membrane protein [Mycobacterium heckeshornense]BCQ06802.1 terminal beta-(1->2)-arabinofuranosyltransferase [Mycobacterium heckeshornense]HZS20314.1 flagellar motor control protein ZomB [Pseudonocardiaceae bacterium]
MLLLRSASPRVRAASRRAAAVARPLFPYDTTVRISLWVSVAVVAVLFGWGAWQRRWIADDGLIVLRTVRNLLAGNGPVFNAGERVEANTSTVWTFLLYLGGLIGGPLRLEYVALVMALALSVIGVALLMLGAGRLYAPSLRGHRAVMLPAGALVYIAVPPARDFATSGLESGLALAYLGLLWWMTVCWSQALRIRPEGRVFSAALAFVAGCSVLVRPELALIGGGVLIMMLVAARGWRRRALIVLAGGLLPVGYEVFRMGYYGLLVPGTALAKDAAGDKWSQGMIYLANFNRPYVLWVPAVLLLALGLLLAATRSRPWRIRHEAPRGYGPLARAVQSPPAAVIFFVISGLLQALYWIRQGGDFMHGRVLLIPMVCVLAPVAVVPVVFPEGTTFSRETRNVLAGAVSALWLAVAGWSLWAANSPGMGDDATRVTYSGIVDERRFYAQATGHAHPLTAADYLDYPRMRAAVVAINNTPAGALLLPSGNYNQWDIVPAAPPKPGDSSEKGPHTVFFTNIGMVGMNVGLDVRVIDQIGLANPLAAHTPRLHHSRIGHDKNLFPDWAIAEGPFVGVPPYLDPAWVEQARAALKCPATQAVLSSVRAPMGVHRFLSNMLHSYQFTKYRIDRVPLYDLIRCGLEVPETGAPAYTGLPATGP